ALEQGRRHSRNKTSTSMIQPARQQGQGGLSLRTQDAYADVQTLSTFLRQAHPPKDPLATGLINRRDLVALGARRRHGKTTFVIQLALDLATGAPAFLDYPIPEPRRSLLLLLEDDPVELQDKI